MVDDDVKDARPTGGLSRSDPGLLGFVLASLDSQVHGRRDFEINRLQSQPKRAYALFPWASDPSVKVYQEHVLLLLAERPIEANSSDSPADANSPNKHVPICGIELAIYTVPATSTALIYIAKVDTTGLCSAPAPARILTTALLRYYMLYPPHSVNSLRIHIFARAQDQYLFPGSIDNKKKRVLDDKGLCKWWRQTVGNAVAQAKLQDEDKNEASVQLYYLLAGYDYAESLLLLSAAPPDEPAWTYGHPYRTTPSPLTSGVKERLAISDLIPAFQDDPKSRYLTSLTSSPVPAAGEEGDYDEVAEQLNRVSTLSPTLQALRNSEMAKQLAIERSRLAERDIDEFWECMGGRQECCSGHVAGFFVAVCDRKTEASAGKDAVDGLHDSQKKHAHSPQAVRGALVHGDYIRLWSAIHNVDYSSLDKAGRAYTQWTADVISAASRNQDTAKDLTSHVKRCLSVNNAMPEAKIASTKRMDPPKAVTTLQPRKKKKLDAAA
ncbi:hypothetical protein EMMF5_004107 [Cystobasidiomycetes sp. EMM_F5]